MIALNNKIRNVMILAGMLIVLSSFAYYLRDPTPVQQCKIWGEIKPIIENKTVLMDYQGQLDQGEDHFLLDVVSGAFPIQANAGNYLEYASFGFDYFITTDPILQDGTISLVKTEKDCGWKLYKISNAPLRLFAIRLVDDYNQPLERVYARVIYGNPVDYFPTSKEFELNGKPIGDFLVREGDPFSPIYRFKEEFYAKMEFDTFSDENGFVRTGFVDFNTSYLRRFSEFPAMGSFEKLCFETKIVPLKVSNDSNYIGLLAFENGQWTDTIVLKPANCWFSKVRQVA